MANTFVTLPAPAGNGSGAGVDTSALGKERTITVQGTFRGSVIIEVSADGGTSWGELCVFTGRGGKTYQIAADFMRVTRAGVPDISPGTPVVEIGSNDDGGLYTSLAAPAGNGTGAAVDVSTFGAFKTGIAVGGRGLTIIEISQDGGTTWQEAFSFTTGSVISKEIVAEFARVKRTGVPVESPGLPVVALGAIVDAGGGGGGGGGGLAVYGDGSDGDVTISANTTLARTMYYENLTVQAGFTLTPDGFAIYVRNTLTVEAGARISANGNNGTNTPGANGGAGIAGTNRALWSLTTFGGGAGNLANGSSGQGSATDVGCGAGGRGGDSGTGNTGGNAGLAGAFSTARGGIRAAPFLNWVRIGGSSTAGARGGSGGGGGAGNGVTVGAGGGGGGLLMQILARHIVNDGAISADGGNGGSGAAANTGGGGGGGGGGIWVLYDSFTGNTPTVAGGAGGSGGAGGQDGIDGNDGLLVLLSNT